METPNSQEKDFDAEEHLSRLKPGCVLVARSSLFDPNFAATEVLICQHSTEGAYGLVLNRASHMPLSEVFEGQEFDPKLKRPVYIGGPVQAEELQILQVTDTPASGAMNILPSLYLGGVWPELKTILAADVKSTRLFLGYSGWGAGQLEEEIQAAAWDVLSVNVKAYLLAKDENRDIRQFLSSSRNS